jgi:hypothetical protein
VGIEIDVAPLPQRLLGGEDDLAGVVAHVLDGVQQGAETIRLPALDRPLRGEGVIVQGGDHVAATPHHRGEAIPQLVPSERVIGRKLEGSPSRMALAPEARQHPLREVAAEMEDEVAHAVAARSGPRPHLAPVEAIQAEAYLAKVLLEVAFAEPPQPLAVDRHRPLP